jgi:L-ascorbate metabolism protein UlaG (beta-lactamase superfamily)
MANAGVPDQRLLAVGPGDLIELAGGLRARVLPSLHSCTWTSTTPAGDGSETEVPVQERHRRLATSSRRAGFAAPEVAEHIRAAGERSRGDGGALGYLIDTAVGRIYWADTSGYFTGVARDLRPSLAILAAAGRGNVDGEPSPEPLPEFLATEVALMRPDQVVLCHHDDWMPPVTAAGDVAAIQAAVAARVPGVPVHSLEYGKPLRLS